MPIFYPPPGPHVGGKQPYDPGRRITPPQAPPNPPFGHPARLTAAIEQTIRWSWEPPFPGYIGKGQPYDSGRRVTPPQAPPNPPFGHPTRLTAANEQVVRWSWESGWNPVQKIWSQTISGPVVTTIPFSQRWLNTVLYAWQPAFQQPVQKVETPILGSADNPPFQHPARDVEKYIKTFDPELWKRSSYSGGNEIVPPPVIPDDPPLFSRAGMYSQVWEWQEAVYTMPLPPVSEKTLDNPPVNTNWQQGLIQWWQLPEWRQPQVRIKFTRAPAVPDTPPLIGAGALEALLIKSWDVPWWSPAQPGKVTPPQQPPGPPQRTNVILNLLEQLWIPGPPQPWQGPRLFPIPSPVINEPPYPGVSSMEQILRAWEPGPPQPVQLGRNVIQEGVEPPPPQPTDEPITFYGPALTRWQRQRWFDSNTSGAFESPILRQARAEAVLRLKQIEIGLLPEEKEIIEERIEARVAQVIEQPEISARPMGKSIDRKAIVAKVVAQVRAEIEQSVKREREADDELAMMLINTMFNKD